MTTPKFITYEQGEAALDWIALTDALAAGHALPRAEIEDSFLYRRDDTLLSRAAWIDGLGSLVKTATIFPGNAAAGKPAVNGAVTLFSDRTGEAEAFVDFHLVTKWKTAGDSLLAARRLARPESRNILILGAGTVAGTLIEAYGAAFSGAKFTLWNRTKARAEALAEKTGAAVAEDLAEAVAAADIIATATMSTEPVLKGEWLQPGQHIDLIGAYRPDMREADDAVLTRARLFVDSRATTVGHIGELKDPLARGVIGEGDIVADYYQLDAVRRESAEEITVAKNGGGAHLDLMTARHILDRVGA
ncbi:ornithine cyclodeaminase family protein [Oceanicola sp. 502str15]|uniref:ornithine cyclodeaminase family protein n=1 Tax=Oceanicola sp. 502str15 TaxID=2696061 RepID=UPI002096294C|nr:NAD(P)-binding domain-containing protein [Oceanicola sp. 502str15]MCO6383673.1 NAD(P)-binding domain-containing protein [Oceanicola sp. 502str15]